MWLPNLIDIYLSNKMVTVNIADLKSLKNLTRLNLLDIKVNGDYEAFHEYHESNKCKEYWLSLDNLINKLYINLKKIEIIYYFDNE